MEINMRYTVEKSLLTGPNMKDHVFYMVMDNGIPEFTVNEWLDMKSARSPRTGRQYAYSIVRFLNFLSENGKDYKSATKKDILQFIGIVMRGDEKIVPIKSAVTGSTGAYYLGVIKYFYRYLEDSDNPDLVVRLENKVHRVSNQAYLYGQIWDMDTKEILKQKVLFPKSKKEHVKWYTEEQKEAILSNLNTNRDKAIFLLSLQGMRIDEILMLRLDDYEPSKKTIQINYAKGGKSRKVFLTAKTIKYLEDYIMNERSTVEEKVGVKEEMFLNIRGGKNFGQVVKYSNILKILKRAAEHAGLNPDMVRTHSGRSTWTMDMIHYQAEHPEDNISDAAIMLAGGWSSPSSMKPYLNMNDERILAATMKKKKKERDNNGS